MLTFTQQVYRIKQVVKMSTIIDAKTIKDHKTYDENPFPILGITTRTNKYGGKVKKMVDDDGVAYKMQELSTEEYVVDEKKFVKVYEEAFLSIKDLSTPALRLFCYISIKLKINKDEVFLEMDSCNKFCGYDSRQPFYKGLLELLNKHFIARKVGSDHSYYINTNLLFNGNRAKLVELHKEEEI